MEVRFKLENIDDIKWFKSFPKEERLNVLQQCVTLGRVILSVQPKLICSPNEFMTPFQNQIDEHLENVKTVIDTSNRMAFEPVVGRFNHLCSRIDELTNITSKSALKGKMGEELIARGVNTVFPEIEIADMSKKEHETDYHLTVPNPKIKILLEIKTYTNTVPTSQIDKLYQDIAFTGFKYAIMISTTSGIAKHKNFDWEIYKDCMIVYITNAGLNGLGAVNAIQFILAVHQFKSTVSSSGLNLDTLELESFATVFGEQLEKYHNHLNQFAKLKYNFSKFEATMSNGLRDLFTEILEMESESRRIALELSQTFHQKLLPLTNSGGDGVSEINTERGKIMEFIDKQPKNGKKENYTHLLGYIDKFKLDISIGKDDEWLILKDKKIISKTESGKHSVALVFNIKKGENYSFTGMEKIRGKQLLVQVCKENHDNIEKLLSSRKKDSS